MLMIECSEPALGWGKKRQQAEKSADSQFVPTSSSNVQATNAQVSKTGAGGSTDTGSNNGTSVAGSGGKVAPTVASLGTSITTSSIDREDMKDFTLFGSGGGHAGLPQVNLYLKKSESHLFWHGAPFWTDDQGDYPSSMNYSGWNFWQMGVWDALLQLLAEQATDAAGRAQKLGRYHLRMLRRGPMCWSQAAVVSPPLVLDLSGEVPVTDTFRADRHITYGLTNRLFIRGRARMLVTIDKKRRVGVEVLDSSFSPQTTSNLKTSILSLNNHPVVGFPIEGEPLERITMIAEFIVDRKPGPLPLAKPASSRYGKTAAPSGK